MKLLGTHLGYFLGDPQTRRNVRSLLRYCLFLLGVILVYSELFHLIMVYVEGQDHSWLTGVYWTLVVMSTLGFGDITFATDIGRLFSVVVLVSGIILLLVVLPFSFIRYFFAPWLEARIRSQAPRCVPPTVRGHVILVRWDELAAGLLARLRLHGIPCYVLEENPERATLLLEDGVPVVAGDPESRATYEALRFGEARLLIANGEDTTNTNITLTAREISQSVPILSLAANVESIDILEFSGSNHVLPLKKWLGEQLANRVTAGHAHAHVVGRYRDLLLAELPVHRTFLSGKTVRLARLRERFGLGIAGIWEHGKLLSPAAETKLGDDAVLVVAGAAERLDRLNQVLEKYDLNPNPVLIVGGGNVGISAARALHERGIPVTVLDRDRHMARHLRALSVPLVVGDAADRDTMMRAGLQKAPSVILSTNDDAMNIFLAIYCRRLRPDVRIISRITYERNLEAIHRAGADLVLSHTSLGVGTILSYLRGTTPVILGEGIDLFHLRIPASLQGKTLADSGIGARTGLNVIALEGDDRFVTDLPPTTVLESTSQLLVIGTPQQRETFARTFH